VGNGDSWCGVHADDVLLWSFLVEAAKGRSLSFCDKWWTAARGYAIGHVKVHCNNWRDCIQWRMHAVLHHSAPGASRRIAVVCNTATVGIEATASATLAVRQRARDAVEVLRFGRVLAQSRGAGNPHGRLDDGESSSARRRSHHSAFSSAEV